MRYLLIAMVFLGMFSCKEREKEASESKDETVEALFENFYEDYLRLNPVTATSVGDKRYNDQFPNAISEEYREKLRSFYEKYKDELLSFERSQLDPQNQTSYDVLLWECDINLEEMKYPLHLTPVNQFYSVPNLIGQLASGKSFQPFETVDDYDNWLKRVDGYLAWCDTAIANMKKGIEQGHVLPKALTLKVIPQFEGLASGPVESHLFYGPVTQMPDTFSEEEKTQLTNAYRDMVQRKVIPTYKKLSEFMSDEYLAGSRESSGIDDTPLGDEFYQFRVKKFTTTNMTADEVFNLGKQEVARLSAEMEKVKKEIGFEGDLKAFFDHVRNKKELMPFTDPQQVIDNFNRIHEKMKPNLEKLFDKVPKAAFEVRRTEAFREKSASAEYNSPSLDGSRPGIFYVPIPDVKTYNIFSDEDLFLHEAIPGHHYQIALQQENTALPDFRKILWYSAYGEGWALYSESMGKELGLYEDPYQYFGMLSAEMHRAIRLVVDAGMHSKGWTREQAIQYSLDHEAESEESIIAEIERYVSWPGQALSYKIGQIKILELRDRAQKALGQDFDIKEFHNKVLESGSVPLSVLQKKIDEWIAEEKS